MRHGYLIDMDGVLYRGSEIIREANRFVAELRRRDVPFRFLTNNSQRSIGMAAVVVVAAGGAAAPARPRDGHRGCRGGMTDDGRALPR